jgi:transposase
MDTNPIQKIQYDDFINYSKEELICFFKEQKKYTDELLNENNELKECNKLLTDKILVIEGQLVVLRNKIFRKKSEKSTLNKNLGLDSKGKNSKEKKKPEKRSLLPSENYPEAAIIESHIELKDLPHCTCCGNTMEDSGMTEDSECLTVVPKEYLIIQQKRHKYRCGKCHGEIKTAPSAPRIIPGSTYSDEMIIDVAMAKYCDLVPIERYSTIAGREGLVDLPPNSLIGTTHKLAEYVEPAFHKVREEIMSSKILHADETPHRMLEGDDKKSWYLWGFSNKESSYFEIRNTRSGDVASELLNQSKCQYLVSDVFSGYARAVRESNIIREQKKQPAITSVYCNAHSRRKFKEAEDSFPKESDIFIEYYRKIYQLEAEGKKDTATLSDKRTEMKALFEEMKKEAESQRENFSAKSSLVTAINYFLKNYTEFTLFLYYPFLPIDNNHQEGQLRNPVIGRKTWFGTHSKQGAKTTSIFFTLVESCKLNKINPRHYFKKLIQHLHAGLEAFTPKEFKDMLNNSG